DHLPADVPRPSVLRSFCEHAQRDEVIGIRLGKARPHRGDDEITGHDFHSLDVHWLEVEEAELANRLHDARVSRIAESLVLHRGDLALVAKRHRGETASRVKSFQLAQRSAEVNLLELRKRFNL